MKHLLIFTIGPVQSFIAQARKVQDLAAGSRMLSDLIAKVMDYAKKKANAQIIFPYYGWQNKNKENDYPNRFIAFIETNDPQKFGEELEKHVIKEFLNKAEQKLKSKLTDNQAFEHSKEQLKHILKIYWVILPDTDETKYDKEVYQKIERLHGGMKNLRRFEQFAEKGRKCSVNGEYNVIVYRKKKDDDKPKWLNYTNPVKVIEPNDNNPIPLKSLSYGEGLSAISFYKRLYELPVESFDATCQIAYLDSLNQINDKKVQVAVEKILQKDEQLLYKDNQTKKNLDKLGIKQEELESEFRTVNNYFKKDNELQKYYAVLLFDADNMGKWISGEFLKDSEKLFDFQNILSGKLGEFARYAKNYVNGNNDGAKKGQTIYAGGDDFLGLINLKYLPAVLKHLREKFKEIISGNIQEEYLNESKEFTFSAGIAIAHYKTPLNFVLNEARAAEHSAKEDGDRNALAITVLKRSGEIHKSVFKWYDNNQTFLPDKLFTIVSTLKTKESSNKFITNFTREFLPVSESLSQKHTEMIRHEMERLLHLNKIESLESAVFSLLDYFIKEQYLKDYIHLLNIADFFSRNINSVEF